MRCIHNSYKKLQRMVMYTNIQQSYYYLQSLLKIIFMLGGKTALKIGGDFTLAHISFGKGPKIRKRQSTVFDHTPLTKA